MRRAVLWSLPRRDHYDQVLRDSKCGHFRIVTRAMSSSNGHWNARVYCLEDRAEFENNPDWEPEG